MGIDGGARQLGDKITEVQMAYLDTYGYLHFEQVADPDEVSRIESELSRIEEYTGRDAPTVVT